MDIFYAIGSGASVGSTLGGYAATLTHRSTVVGTVIGGLVGAGCGWWGPAAGWSSGPATPC